MEKESSQASTYPEHNCYAWNHQHWHNQSDAIYQTCGICNKITHFRWKSIWTHLRFIFWDSVSTFRGDTSSQE